MAASSSKSGRMTVSEKENSPERTKVWTEPANSKLRKVPVVYYLSRNGQLQHPHFIEVHLSSPQGLFLRDVINRLNSLRGKSLASMYSWSCKRSYKNGFVWHDLSEDDFIYPAHGQEYILKGSELVHNTFLETGSSFETQPLMLPPLDPRRTGDEIGFRREDRRRRNQSCSSIDLNLHEYNVYKAEHFGRAVSDASTQTNDKHRNHWRPGAKSELKGDHAVTEEESISESYAKEQYKNQAGDEIEIETTPPSSDSSPETLETLMKADGRMILRPETVHEDQTVSNNNKARPFSVLMQLISCGSVSIMDCGAGHGQNLISQYKIRLPRGGGSSGVSGGTRKVKLEEKEYFSGSLVETRKEEFPALKRSSSYNADRTRHLEISRVRVGMCESKMHSKENKTSIHQKRKQCPSLLQ